jgi:hypothetical protein
MNLHSSYRFSVTISSTDLAVINCLRSLAQYSQRAGNNRIPWGGTKDEDWERDQHKVTFRFSTPEYRIGFLAEARRLLPTTLWSVARQSDQDPARSQST